MGARMGLGERRFDVGSPQLDLRLPDISGDHVLAELRVLAREPERVVFMTGDTQNESTRHALDAAGRPVISKPFLLDELAAVVLAEPETSRLG